ncbi:MAG: hypothetical protein VB089_04890 [Anaerolineaceae bacterium]|nr:hypothetical protein [Anaerolineaceae bacterium]
MASLNLNARIKMLFWLDSSLADAIKETKNSNVISSAINRIIDAQIYGNHLYFSDYRTLKTILNNGNIENRAKEHLLKIYNSYSEKGLYRDFRIYVEVIWGNNLREIIKKDNKTLIRLSPDVIMNSRITERAIFLCENSRDIKLYSRVADFFLGENRSFRGLKIDYDSINGGGNNISDQYDLFQKENQKFCLCIVDTDWEYKGANFGNTAQRLLQVHNRNITNGIPKVFCVYKPILSREAENLIPFPIFQELIFEHPDCSGFINWLEQLERKNIEARFFVNIKEGLYFKKIVEKGDKEAIRYWAKLLKDWLNGCNYLQEEICLKDCACFKVQGIGNHVLDQVLPILERTTNQKLGESLKRYPMLYEQWMDIGESIFYWFVCAAIDHIH